MTFPVTSLYAATLGLLLVVLSDLVSRGRRRSQVSLGHGGDPMLERTMRAHGNFVEYVPLGLILLGLAATASESGGYRLFIGTVSMLWLLAALAGAGLGAVGAARGRYVRVRPVWDVLAALWR